MQKKFYIAATLVISFIILYFLILSNLGQSKFNFIDKFLDQNQKKLVKLLTMTGGFIQGTLVVW